MSVKLTPVTVQIVLVPNLARTSSTEHIKIEKEKNKQIVKKTGYVSICESFTKCVYTCVRVSL